MAGRRRGAKGPSGGGILQTAVDWGFGAMVPWPEEGLSLYSAPFGQVAQLVEQRTENPRVGGSIPSLATQVGQQVSSKSTDRLHDPPEGHLVGLVSNRSFFYPSVNAFLLLK